MECSCEYKDSRRPQNLRPISLMNTLTKAFTNLIYNRLIKYVERNQILNETQFGFRRGRSTKQYSRMLLNIIEDSKKWNKPLHLIILDIGKAFDSIQHKLIEKILSYIKVPKIATNVIMDLYKNAKSRLKIEDYWGDTFQFKRPIWQGDSLSPLLFILAINPILETFNKHNTEYKIGVQNSIKIGMLGYCDDITGITRGESEMEKITEKMAEITEDFAMELAPEKTVYMSNRDQANDIVIKIKGKEEKIHTDQKTTTLKF